MESREQLDQRVAELEKQVAALKPGRAVPVRGVRKRAAWGIAAVPFYDIAVGPDPQRGEMRGHAKGIIAIGDVATGVLALGGLARGVVAFGGLAVGLVSAGGLSLGLLAGGGVAVGGAAFGGGAVGGVAVGGAAAGYYACGGKAFGSHIVDATRRDPAAENFFARYAITPLCRAK